MAIVVETGAVVSGANSYVTLAQANTYWQARNDATWLAAAEADREAALIKACVFLDMHYRNRWKGQRSERDQEREWPRSFVVDDAGYAVNDDTIPQAVKDAQCELALRALSDDLAPDLARGGRVVAERVGPISVQYAESAPASTVYRQADLLLGRYIDPAMSSRIQRA